MNPDPEKENAIVDVVLRDEAWESASAACKAEALRVFRARQCVRRLTRWVGAVAALGIVAGYGIYSFSRPIATKHETAKANFESSRKSTKPHDLTDEALIALFPAGSCLIAEIDGKKELIFLDPNVERMFLSDAGSKASSLPR